jgi:methionine-rich copper-binding protein CopC
MRARAAAAAALLALVPVLAVAAPASAHNYLVSSSPEVGSTIAEVPAQFSVTTNDDLLQIGDDTKGFGILVTDAAGRYYGDGCIAVDGPTVSMPASLGEPGDYTLTWQVVSADGHSVSDSFPFTWTGAATSAGSTSVPDCNGTREVGTPAPQAGASGGTAVDVTTVAWIGGAVLAVLIAVGVTLVLVRPRSGAGKKPVDGSERD